MALNIFKKEKEEVEYFWSLVIGRLWVDAGIWRVVAEKAEVVAHGGASSWEEGKEETLIEAADSALSSAVAEVEEEIPEPNKVVFGLPFSWLVEGEIKKEKLEILKKLSKELELAPAGFVVVSEAITHFLKSKEGVPPHAILIGADSEGIEVSLLVNGKILGTTEVARSMSLASDLVEGLARLPQAGQYPSRILLYNHRGADLDEAKQNLLDADWEKIGLTFLHTPKVEILPEDVGVLSVSLAGGAEVGHAKSLAEEHEVEVGEEHQNVEEVAPESLGFFSKDVVSQEASQEKAEPPLTASISGENVQEKQSIFSKLGEVFSVLSQVRIPRRKTVLLAGLVGVVLLFAFVYWYFPKAEVSVYVSPKKINKAISFKVEQGISNFDAQASILPGRFLDVEVSAEKTASTTGTKTIGEKSRGEVTIYRVGPAVTVPHGSTLSSGSGLRFTLDDNVSVASGSAGSPGTAKGKVTAYDIGGQYNLAAGTTFKVGNLSSNDAEAKNESSFAGGTSRQVPSVSEADRKEVEGKISEELGKLAVEKTKNSVGQDEVILGQTPEVSLAKRDYSNKVGDETETIRLSATGKARLLIVSKKQLTGYVASQLSSEIPSGFLLKEDGLELSSVSKSNEGTYTAEVVVNFLPQVNPDEIRGALAGKTQQKAREYLSGIPGFTRAQISFTFKFPGPLGTLPRVRKHIIIDVVAEK